MTRRQAVAGAAAMPLAGKALAATGRHDVIIVGAGVFGSWTAEKLRRSGKRVLLVDGWGPAHARASSGGESRLTRGAYGADEIYTRMALDSLADWKALSDTAGLPIFHQSGVLFFFPAEDAYSESSMTVHRRMGLDTQRLEAAELRRRWPQVDWTGTAFGIYEPGFGALMARRSVETLVQNFVRAGGAYRRAAILPPVGQSLTGLRTADGETLTADSYVFACGPWLPKLFPALLADRMFVTRQAIFFFATPAGDSRFSAAALPGWADFDSGDLYYGIPDLEARGFKIAHDVHGPIVDPDVGNRLPTATEIADVTGYMARRFPALAGAPLSEVRVCQYENSANGDFLIDRHPEWPNTVLVGMGSGHGFKHGPAVGDYAAGLVTGSRMVEARFSLASKTTRKARAVH